MNEISDCDSNEASLEKPYFNSEETLIQMAGCIRSYRVITDQIKNILPKKHEINSIKEKDLLIKLYDVAEGLQKEISAFLQKHCSIKKGILKWKKLHTFTNAQPDSERNSERQDIMTALLEYQIIPSINLTPESEYFTENEKQILLAFIKELQTINLNLEVSGNQQAHFKAEIENQRIRIDDQEREQSTLKSSLLRELNDISNRTNAVMGNIESVKDLSKSIPLHKGNSELNQYPEHQTVKKTPNLQEESLVLSERIQEKSITSAVKPQDKLIVEDKNIEEEPMEDVFESQSIIEKEHAPAEDIFRSQVSNLKKRPKRAGSSLMNNGDSVFENELSTEKIRTSKRHRTESTDNFATQNLEKKPCIEAKNFESSSLIPVSEQPHQIITNLEEQKKETNTWTQIPLWCLQKFSSVMRGFLWSRNTTNETDSSSGQRHFHNFFILENTEKTMKHRESIWNAIKLYRLQSHQTDDRTQFSVLFSNRNKREIIDNNDIKWPRVSPRGGGGDMDSALDQCFSALKTLSPLTSPIIFIVATQQPKNRIKVEEILNKLRIQYRAKGLRIFCIQFSDEGDGLEYFKQMAEIGNGIASTKIRSMFIDYVNISTDSVGLEGYLRHVREAIFLELHDQKSDIYQEYAQKQLDEIDEYMRKQQEVKEEHKRIDRELKRMTSKDLEEGNIITTTNLPQEGNLHKLNKKKRKLELKLRQINQKIAMLEGNSEEFSEKMQKESKESEGFGIMEDRLRDSEEKDLEKSQDLIINEIAEVEKNNAETEVARVRGSNGTGVLEENKGEESIQREKMSGIPNQESNEHHNKNNEKLDRQVFAFHFKDSFTKLEPYLEELPKLIHAFAALTSNTNLFLGDIHKKLEQIALKQETEETRSELDLQMSKFLNLVSKLLPDDSLY